MSSPVTPIGEFAGFVADFQATSAGERSVISWRQSRQPLQPGACVLQDTWRTPAPGLQGLRG